MKSSFEPGLVQSVEADVGEEMLPMLDGRVIFPVLPTAEVVRFMELASRRLVAPHLEAWEEVLGVEVQVCHLDTCGVGKHIVATAEVADCRHNRITINATVQEGGRLLATGVLVQRVLPRERAEEAIRAGCG
jgi:predicted thioesterase